MPKYKPMLISFDESGYNHAIKRGNEKIEILNKAIQWAEKHIVISDVELFARSFSKFFMDQYYESNKDKIQLDIKVDKLLELVGINIFELRDLEDKFNSMNDKLDYSDGIKPLVDRSLYENYTKSSVENDKLRAGRKLIEVIKTCESFTKIYPMSIQQATSNLLSYDIRRNKYLVNI